MYWKYIAYLKSKLNLHSLPTKKQITFSPLTQKYEFSFEKCLMTSLYSLDQISEGQEENLEILLKEGK